MKATITFDETTTGNLDVSFTFDPPLTPETKESVVTKAVQVVMDALQANTTPVDKPRIISDLRKAEIITPHGSKYPIE